MTRLLAHIEADDLADNAREVLRAHGQSVTMRTRENDTLVTMHLDLDGYVRLEVRPTGTPAYELDCPPTMPFPTLIKLLETL